MTGAGFSCCGGGTEEHILLLLPVLEAVQTYYLESCLSMPVCSPLVQGRGLALISSSPACLWMLCVTIVAMAHMVLEIPLEC